MDDDQVQSSRCSGQMIHAEEKGYLIYLCSPLVRSLHELQQHNIFVSDIAPHDVTRDFLFHAATK